MKLLTHWKAYLLAAATAVVALSEFLQGDGRGALAAASLLLGAGTMAYLRRAADVAAVIKRIIESSPAEKSCATPPSPPSGPPSA